MLNDLFILWMHIPTLNQVHVIHRFFTVSYLKSMIYLYHGSENSKYLPCYHKYGYMHSEISIAMHGIIQMKLYRATQI